MAARLAVAMSLLLAFGASCSQSKLRPGHCERDSDCLAGESCVLQGAATFTCASSDGGVPNGDGANTGPDVVRECAVNGDCPSGKPICELGSCRPCDASSLADRAGCAARDSAKPVCGLDGSCVECISPTSFDCGTNPSKPICDVSSNTCVRCSTDDQCAAKTAGPGICMSHQDGRCAADDELIFVENKAGCASSVLVGMAGSAGTPFCGPQLAIDALTSARRVIIISGTVAGFQWAPSSGEAPVSMFGRGSAVVAGGTQPGVVISVGADLFIRGPLTIGPGPELGVSASSGATLRLDGVTVDSNRKGGILVDAAAFDLRNSKVIGNGPGDVMGLPWGGVRIQNALSAGPALLDRMTIQTNNPVGLSCSGPIVGNSVLATGNTSVDIATTCGITSCSSAGPTCGAP